MEQLILATSNSNKTKEIQSLFPSTFQLINLKEAGIDSEIPEPFQTLEENSNHKAYTVYLLTGMDCFAEDTGLEVDALHGEPGVLSARYAGEPRNDQRNIKKLLLKMDGMSNRNAQFKTVMTLYLNGQKISFEGICKGEISLSPKGTDGFGYDPVFIPTGSKLTFAEMSLDQKNQFSHRKKALYKMIDYLKKLNNP
jgi:XTP/dITP diphosphohydrolase